MVGSTCKNKKAVLYIGESDVTSIQEIEVSLVDVDHRGFTKFKKTSNQTKSLQVCRKPAMSSKKGVFLSQGYSNKTSLSQKIQ